MEFLMKKKIKTILILGFLAGISYFIYKSYLKVKAMINLYKTLPLYLENICEERPELDLNMSLHGTTLQIGFNSDIIEKYPDMKAMVKEYLEDFYPVLIGKRLTIEIYKK
jgi:hypothetical protein